MMPKGSGLCEQRRVAPVMAPERAPMGNGTTGQSGDGAMGQLGNGATGGTKGRCPRLGQARGSEARGCRDARRPKQRQTRPVDTPMGTDQSKDKQGTWIPRGAPTKAKATEARDCPEAHRQKQGQARHMDTPRRSTQGKSKRGPWILRGTAPLATASAACGLRRTQGPRQAQTQPQYSLESFQSLTAAPGARISWVTTGKARHMFIQTESTPNPATLKFLPGQTVLEAGTADFPTSEGTEKSPLAEKIFRVQGVTGVFFGNDFVTVTKEDDVEWDHVKPAILGAIMEHFQSGQPVMLGEAQASGHAEHTGEDAEI